MSKRKSKSTGYNWKLFEMAGHFRNKDRGIRDLLFMEWRHSRGIEL